jgi:glucose-6-phosphate 1-epimerase
MQFGSHGNLEQHGFARTRFWTVDSNPPPLPVNPGVKAFVDLILKPSDEDLKIWPHRSVLHHRVVISFLLLSIIYKHIYLYFWLFHVYSFEFRLRVALGAAGDLTLTSRIRNTSTDGKPFSYTFAYHTYFSVSDIRYLVVLLFTCSHISFKVFGFLYELLLPYCFSILYCKLGISTSCVLGCKLIFE